MTPLEIREARQRLGLSVRDAARLLDMDELTLRRIEMPEDRATRRKPPVRFLRLLKAYLGGYRPEDWPGK